MIRATCFSSYLTTMNRVDSRQSESLLDNLKAFPIEWTQSTSRVSVGQFFELFSNITSERSIFVCWLQGLHVLKVLATSNSADTLPNANCKQLNSSEKKKSNLADTSGITRLNGVKMPMFLKCKTLHPNQFSDPQLERMSKFNGHEPRTMSLNRLICFRLIISLYSPTKANDPELLLEPTSFLQLSSPVKTISDYFFPNK